MNPALQIANQNQAQAGRIALAGQAPRFIERPYVRRTVSDVTAFKSEILSGTDIGKIKISKCYLCHADAATPESDWYTCADATLTLTASKYSAICAKFTLSSSPFVLTIEAKEDTTILGALNAADQEDNIARRVLYVFNRVGDLVTMELDLRNGWHIIPVEAV
jgi:hypothetical protein